MEKAKCISDHHEEVRKLQEKVRELEQQLKSSTLSRNGVSEPSNNTTHVNVNDGEEGLVPVYDVDCNSKTWLVTSLVDSRSEQELFAALLRDGSGASRPLQERSLYAAICNAEQDRRKNIDSRTFTRPKKRMVRPSLEVLESFSSLSNPPDSKFSWVMEANGAELDNMTCSLLESSLMNSMYGSDASTASDITSQLSIVNKKQKVSAQLGIKRGSLVISDINEISVEDVLPPLKQGNGNNVANHMENVNITNFELMADENDITAEGMLESADFSTSLIDSTLMDGNLMDTIPINTKPKLTNSRIHYLNRTFTPSPPPTADSSIRKVCHESQGMNQSLNESLNRTFVKEDEESPNHSTGPNSTFCIETNGSNNGQRSGPFMARPGSIDSGGGDDDQLSSASESSHTSTTRLMSVGDVQHIARLQEESLVMSTPVHRHITRIMDYVEDPLSPILRGPDCGRSSGSSEIQTGGYGSDHSSRSPLSSLHSSPAGSPFGSSTALPGSNQTYLTSDSKLSHRPNGLLQRKNTYGLIQPSKVKERCLRPPAPVAVTTAAPTTTARPTARSGLRPPMIRTGTSGAAGVAGSSGLPRPSTGIPRPSSLSRIPPPKVRSSVSQPSQNKWTDECY